MKQVQIRWKAVEGSQLSSDANAHIFALSQNGRILFFGYGINSSLNEEVNRIVKRCKLEKDETTLWLGSFTDDLQLDKQVVEETMCLLVYTYQPLYNIICKAGYYGRDGLRIDNRGCLLLQSSVYPPAQKLYRGII